MYVVPLYSSDTHILTEKLNNKRAELKKHTYANPINYLLYRIRFGRVYMDADGYHHDGEYAEVEDGVDEDGEGAGAHVAELHHPDPRRQLEQEPRRQQDEQHHRHDDRPPIRRHHLSSLSRSPHTFAVWLCFAC